MKYAKRVSGLLFLLVFNGCGSGSSGFDDFAEEAVIERVTDEGGCATVAGTTICAAGADASLSLSDKGLATPTEMGVTLSIDPPSGSRLPCEGQDGQEGCTLAVRIAASGFPAQTTFVGAVSRKDPLSAWAPGPSPFIAVPAAPTAFETTLPVSNVSVGETAQIRIAVLVYLPQNPFSSNLNEVELLRDFEADVIFVVTDVEIQVVSLP